MAVVVKGVVMKIRCESLQIARKVMVIWSMYGWKAGHDYFKHGPSVDSMNYVLLTVNDELNPSPQKAARIRAAIVHIPGITTEE